MKKIIAILLMLTLFSVSVTATSGAKETSRSVQELNQLRKALSLPLFQEDKNLEEAAITHNRYMNYANSLSSIEEAGKTYYRGRYPWDRASYAGYGKSYVTEMIGKGFHNYSEGWKTFLGDPYLRHQLLHPNYTDIGMDRFTDYSTYLLGGEPAKQEYSIVYPYHQQINVPIQNKYYFGKNPYQTAQKPEISGYPITFTYYTERKIDKIQVESVSLTRLNTNQRISLTYLSKQIANTLIILPLSTFDYHSSYRFQITAKIYFGDGKVESIKQVSQFTTETEHQGTKTNLRYLTRIDFVKRMLQALRYELKTGLGIIFKDVSPASPDYKYIYTASSEKLILGTPNGEFLPQANIKEQDAYVVLIRAYEKKKGNIKLTAADTISFGNDIPSEYAKEALRKAVKIGLIDESRKSFDPNHYLSTEEFDVIMRKYEAISR